MSERIQKVFTGWWIPVEAVEVHGLNPTLAFLWAEIHAMSKSPEGCYAGNDHFAQHLGLSEKRVSALITELKSKGLIEQVSFNGRTRILRAMPIGFEVNRNSQTPDPRAGRLPKNEQSDRSDLGSQNELPYILKEKQKENLKENKDLPGRLEASPAGGAAGEKTPEKKPKAPRKRDPIFDALAELDGIAPGAPVGQWAAGRVAAAKKQVVSITSTCEGVEVAEEIRRRARHYRTLWPDITISSTALVKHWERLANPPPDPLDPGERARLKRQIEDAKSDMKRPNLTLAFIFDCEATIKKAEARLNGN